MTWSQPLRQRPRRWPRAPALLTASRPILYERFTFSASISAARSPVPAERPRTPSAVRSMPPPAAVPGSADGGQDVEPDQGTQHLGHHDRAVGLLVVLEDGDQPAGRGQRAVEGGRHLVAVLPLEPRVQPARLEGRAVRGGGELAVAPLGRHPGLAVVLARGGAAEV